MLMSPKAIIILVVVVLAGIGVFFLYAHLSGNSLLGTGNNGPSVTPTGVQGLPVVAIDPSSVPQDPTLTLGTASGPVTVANFYKTAIGQDAETFLLAHDPAYDISYDQSASVFYLVINGTPFATAQKSAEAKFIQILNVTQPQACKLSVSEKNSATGANAPLSFCAPQE